MNFQSFAELAFSFRLTFEIFYKGMVFSMVMGFVGGLASRSQSIAHDYCGCPAGDLIFEFDPLKERVDV